MYTVSDTAARQGAQVGLIMGSDSDWPTMEAAAEALAEFGVRFEVGVVSAHRTPQRMLDYAKDAAGRGIQVIIAGAGAPPTYRAWSRRPPHCPSSVCPSR